MGRGGTGGAMVVLAGIVSLWGVAAAEELVVRPLDRDSVYDAGEVVGWRVELAPGAPAGVSRYRYAVRKNNAVEVASGVVDLAEGPSEVSIVADAPGMLYAEWRREEAAPDAPPAAVAGAAIDPEAIEPSEPRPDDFDAFWGAKLAELAEVAPNAVITPGESGVAGVRYATLMLDNIHGAHVHGQIAWPESIDGSSMLDRPTGKRAPALLVLQWASPPYPLEREWVTTHAAKGWLVLNVEPHDVLPTESKEYYDALPERIKNYASIGQENREECYFLRMYLGDYQAAEYLTGLPQWDGETFVVMGTSMGGQQSLCLAGLHPRVTHVMANVPAGCDLCAALHNRQGGYPFFPVENPRVRLTAQYFDAANFAPRVKARALVGMGFLDTVCPPAGVWAALNRIPGEKEAAEMPESAHNHQATAEQQAPYTRRAQEWLDALVRGEEPLEE